MWKYRMCATRCPADEKLPLLCPVQSNSCSFLSWKLSHSHTKLVQAIEKNSSNTFLGNFILENKEMIANEMKKK